MKTKSIVFLLFLALFSLRAYAEENRWEEVRFARGTSSATIRSSVTGYNTVNYTVDAMAGQNMTVSLRSNINANYFNIYAPGKGPGGEAMFIGETSGNRYSGRLPATGRYTIQVYLMRSVARRNVRANFTLDVAVSGRGGSAMAPAPGAGVEWPRRYDASGPLVCSARDGSGKQSCEFRVKRVNYGRGGATIWVKKPGSDDIRVLYFKNGRFSTNERISVRQQKFNDTWRVSVGRDEMYFIPESVIFGG
jgi:hypothetical protein